MSRGRPHPSLADEALDHLRRIKAELIEKSVDFAGENSKYIGYNETQYIREIYMLVAHEYFWGDVADGRDISVALTGACYTWGDVEHRCFTWNKAQAVGRDAIRRIEDRLEPGPVVP